MELRHWVKEIVGIQGATPSIKNTRTEGVVLTDGGVTNKQIDKQITSLEQQIGQLDLITQKTRANLIQNIIGHKWMMPSKKELDYYNPSKSSGTITGHLNKLTEAGLVMRVVVPQGDRIRKGPSAFFVLTDKGYHLLDAHSLFIPMIDEIRGDHARVEKTEEIERYEQAPRPTVDVEYDHQLKGDGRQIVKPREYVGSKEERKKQSDKKIVGDSV